MRTEYREVTVKQKVFIADDGTVFDNEDACGDYEFNQMQKKFVCYDEDFNIAKDLYSAMFVKLPTEDAVEYFMKASDICDTITDGIDGPGVYIYNEFDCRGRWFNLEKSLCRIIGGVPLHESTEN